MANLTRKQLSQAEKYITSYGRGRNSISVLMELGQLFHISPEFNSHEPQHSTVHLHVFICTVNFANYIEEAEGHNKKRVKADAAKKMLDRLLHEARSVVFRGDERMETTRISSNLHQPYTLAQTQRSSPATAAPSQSIGNSVGKLQEYCVASNLVTPLYSFQEESLPGNSRKFIAEVKVFGYPSVKSESLNTKKEAKKLAADKMYATIVRRSDDNTDNATVQATEHVSHMDALRNDFTNLQVVDKDEPLTLKGKYPIIETLKRICSDDDCKEILLHRKGFSAMERITELSKAGKFTVEFHNETSPNGDSHMCLLEAKIDNGLVCHGIADTPPQAKELAADNMLSLIRFFS